jgi:hypothetical protein
MEESKKIKGSEEDCQNRLRPPMSVLFRPFGFLALLHQTYVALAYFDYPLQALWFPCSPPSDIGGLSKKTKGLEEDSQNSLRPPMSEGGEEDNQRA